MFQAGWSQQAGDFNALPHVEIVLAFIMKDLKKLGLFFFVCFLSGTARDSLSCVTWKRQDAMQARLVDLLHSIIQVPGSHHGFPPNYDQLWGLNDKFPLNMADFQGWTVSLLKSKIV